MSFFLAWFTVITPITSDKIDRLLLNCCYLFWGPLFIGIQCITITRMFCIFAYTLTLVLCYVIACWTSWTSGLQLPCSIFCGFLGDVLELPANSVKLDYSHWCLCCTLQTACPSYLYVWEFQLHVAVLKWLLYVCVCFELWDMRRRGGCIFTYKVSLSTITSSRNLTI